MRFLVNMIVNSKPKNKMNTTKVITNVNRQVIDFIKNEISNKKERHKNLIQSIKPSMIEDLKKMHKVGR